MDSTANNGLSAYINPPAYNGPGVYNGVDSYIQEASFVLLRLAQAVVSMVCYDGTDGKGNAYQLTAVFDDGGDHSAACTWSTSNPALGVVSASGIFSAVLGGSGTVEISCSLGGVTKTVLITVYPTLPALVDLYSLPGGKGANLNEASWAPIDVFQTKVPPNFAFNAVRAASKSFVGTSFIINETSANVSSSAPLEYQNAGGLNSSCIRTQISSTQYTDYFIGPTITPNTKNDFDLGKSGAQFFVNGVSVSPVSTTTGAAAAYEGCAIFFSNLLEKIVLFSGAELGISIAELLDYSKADCLWSPQNFVKFTDYDTFFNYVEILNMGTKGQDYNQYCNNTSIGWF